MPSESSAQPQPVLAPLTPAAIFLVVTMDEGGEATVHDALPDISGQVRAIGFRDPTKHLSVIASVGSEAWDRLFTGPRPAELHPFIELEGPRHAAPATPGDLLFHIRAETMDVCFELANRILKSMAGAVTGPPGSLTSTTRRPAMCRLNVRVASNSISVQASSVIGAR